MVNSQTATHRLLSTGHLARLGGSNISMISLTLYTAVNQTLYYSYVWLHSSIVKTNSAGAGVNAVPTV
jgi:hypothetical protein